MVLCSVFISIPKAMLMTLDADMFFSLGRKRIPDMAIGNLFSAPTILRQAQKIVYNVKDCHDTSYL
jgi:hypothetical protein